MKHFPEDSFIQVVALHTENIQYCCNLHAGSDDIAPFHLYLSMAGVNNTIILPGAIIKLGYPPIAVAFRSNIVDQLTQYWRPSSQM